MRSLEYTDAAARAFFCGLKGIKRAREKAALSLKTIIQKAKTIPAISAGR